MTKVKVFVYGSHRQRGYDNSSPDFRQDELKMCMYLYFTSITYLKQKTDKV